MLTFEVLRQELIAEGWDPAFVSGMTDGALELVVELRRNE